ncbi:MAG: hypothetical protein NWR45_09610 [Candidatus Nanopelagicales bacterium]|jgi:hypothetical protein|nr:hypothetical protein [Candidatus Nanopelagicales bacterium]
MRTFRSSKLAFAAVSLAAVATLSACGGSSDSASDAAAGDSGEVAVEEEVAVEGGTGAMADAGFAVTTYMDTIWPIEGNPYADAPAAGGWCATYATDPAGAVTAVEAYLAVEPDIAGADPASVATAIDEYLLNNCYLIEE